jgi:hypothetical protein
VSGELHSLAALLPEIEPPVPFGQEAARSRDLVWMLWKRELSLVPTGNLMLIARIRVSFRSKFWENIQSDEVRLRAKEETSEVLHLEHSFVWCRNLDSSEIRSEVSGKF